MFNSNIKVSDLINSIREEADIAVPITYDSYIAWLNSLEQMLYSEIIKEQEKTFVEVPTVNLASIAVPEGNSNIRYEDIHAVYRDGLQLKETTVASGTIFPNIYFKTENNLAHTKGLEIIYIVRPKLKTVETMEDDFVMLPPEFIDLAKAKLRGEAYKLANEDGLAAKWLNDYNVLLETFKVWIQSKAPAFGI